VWSVLSLIALLGGIGLLFAAFGRWDFLGWRGREQATLSFRTPGDVALTPAQRACAWFFLVMAALFLVQTLVGAASQHYRADLASFFGVDLAQWLPYNLMRTWHVQLAIFWVAASFLAAGIFLAPMIAGREPRGQRLLAFGLLGALAVVVFGSLIGEYAGIFGLTGDLWAWFGNQGFEYLDLGRFWQILLSIGLSFWVVMLFRAMRGRLRREHMGNMPWLFFFAALAIPAFYAVGLLARPDSHFTTALFCLRYLIPEERWSERAAKISFWSLNIGLAWMCFATLFPLGILQLYQSVSVGYYEARTLEFLTNETNAPLEWIRLPGDVVFIVGGVLPLLYLCYLGVRHTVPRITIEEPEDILFTEITEPETAGPRER
jgi:nitric oxide reductase large subunit